MGACWCRIGGGVCSGGHIHQGSQGLFQLGSGRSLSGIGTVVSGSFGRDEALALVVGDFEVLLKLGPSLLKCVGGLHQLRAASAKTPVFSKPMGVLRTAKASVIASSPARAKL